MLLREYDSPAARKKPANAAGDVTFIAGGKL
jgi:hypothetical protein